MKNKTIISFLIVCIIICLSIIFFQHRKINFYESDLKDLLGENKYIIETVDNNHTTFYAINHDYEGYDIFLDYMESLGYKEDKDAQLGRLHCFLNSDGKKISTEVTNYRNIIICEIYF